MGELVINRQTRTTNAVLGSAVLVLLGAGCVPRKPLSTLPPRPSIAPTVDEPSADPLELDSSYIEPMFTTLVAIDLPTVVQVATLQNLEIEEARQAVVASKGELESTVGAVFPAIVPTALFEHAEGDARATEGNLVDVVFNSFQASAAIQWVINPGRVMHDIVAAKKRLSAADFSQRAVVLETLRRSVVEYYDLILAQARVSTAHLGARESEELFRINRLRTQTGVGVLADELRAEAHVARRQQDLILAMREFYDASVILSVTLHLDSAVTLVPKIDELPPIHLVRNDLHIEELLGIATTFRPDLVEVRELVEAVAADKGSTWWGAFGPQFRASYEYGGIASHAHNINPSEGIPSNLIVNPTSSSGAFNANPVANGWLREGIARGSRDAQGRGNQTDTFRELQRGRAGVGWRFSLAAFGDLKTAGAIEEQARIQATRKLDEVRAQVVVAAQSSRANKELISLSKHQVTAAAEALRLTEANLEAGTMTTLDVLQAQDAVTRARLRNAEAVVRYNQSQVNLVAALGLLNEESLDLEPQAGDTGSNTDIDN